MSFVQHRFELNESTKEELQGMTPEFGFDGFGELVFYRTYSRAKEDGSMESWTDVVIRVTEGTFSIRKDWYLRNHITWDEDFWQHYALHFAISMFKMEWLPPGRGLWAMGSDFVYERGSMALYNCAHSSIGDNIGRDVNWCMDSLMNGVGVGFTPERNDELITYLPTQTYTYIIPDSREGWCDSTEALINSFLSPDQKKPVFDYSLVRPAGLPIRGFGGVSSGPEPLIDLHKKIEHFFEMYRTLSWYDSVLLKADIINCVGVCVVAGNVRRSAEIICLPITDPVFLDMKDYEKYPYRGAHGWMSKNSAILEDDSDFELLGEIASRVIKAGEPGILNKKNFPLGRIGKKGYVKPDPGTGTNPCCCGETKVYTADGRGYVPINQLTEEGKDLPVFCIDDKDQLCVRLMRNPRITGENQKIFKVIFDDGSSVRVTENHRFMMRDRSYKEVRNLVEGDALAVANRYKPLKSENTYWDDYYGYSYSGQSGNEHRLIGDFLNGSKLPETTHIHHHDGDKENNQLENLHLTDATTHLSNHSYREQNPNFSGLSSDDLITMGVNLSKKLKRRFSDKEWRESGGIKMDSVHRREQFNSFHDFASMCADLAGVINFNVDIRVLKTYLALQDQNYEVELQKEELFVTRICESCKQPFQINQSSRERAYCSHTCCNYGRDYTKATESNRKIHAQKREALKEQQLDVYTQLKFELGGIPQKAEWMQRCKDLGVSCEMCRDSSPFRRWIDLKIAARGHNHRVVQVIFDGYETVYNGTVDEFHNFIIGGWAETLESGREVERGIINPQCGEIILDAKKEVCNIAESLPTKCSNVKDWFKACEYATMYMSTVSLLPTHQPETNNIVARNRRIGLSIIDITGWMAEIGTHLVIKYMREGYDIVKKTNQWLNSEAGVPEAIRCTTVKPGGSVPKLAGRTSGAGFFNFRFMIRNIRVAKNSKIHPLLVEANIPYEQDVNDSYTDVFSFPTRMYGKAKTAGEASLFEQAMNLVMIQREWADNAVSNTLNFRPKWVLKEVGNYSENPYWYGFDTEEMWNDSNGEAIRYEDKQPFSKMTLDFHTGELKYYLYDPHHEEDDILPVLSMIVPLTKSISLLPHTAKGVYKQMPEIGITEEEYNRLKSQIQPIDWTKLTNNIPEGEAYCQGDKCERPV